MTECAAEVHLRALADCIRHPERYDLSARSLADVVSPEGAPPMQAHPIVDRWAAFTNDELAALTEATDYLMLGDVDKLKRQQEILDRLFPEIDAELERRKP